MVFFGTSANQDILTLITVYQSKTFNRFCTIQDYAYIFCKEKWGTGITFVIFKKKWQNHLSNIIIVRKLRNLRIFKQDTSRFLMIITITVTIIVVIIIGVFTLSMCYCEFWYGTDNLSHSHSHCVPRPFFDYSFFLYVTPKTILFFHKLQ